MKYSQNPFKTTKNISSELQSKNARLLTKAGFIHQEIAGVYTFLPLGYRVLRKIEQIVREEMDKIGVEIHMTSLAPRQSWEQTKRVDSVDVLLKVTGANKLSLEKNDTEYILSPTHEEIVTPLLQEFAQSYRDLPAAVYQIQTKFRNEPRAKSGLLRGREFRMKDLYSFHANEVDLLSYYELAKQYYMNVYNRLGIGEDTFITFASGGDFTDQFSHEYQTLIESGEDTIYLDREHRVAYNKEIVNEVNEVKLGIKFADLEVVKAAEVGNIFPLNTKFSNAFNYTYTDEQGNKQPVFMGCYGIGTSRLMGVLVEKLADARGMIWPKVVAPFAVHLIDIPSTSSGQVHGSEIYNQLTRAGIEVLWDDRDVRPGEKFADADLIGIPVRLVVSAKTSERIEWKERTGDATELISVDEVIKRMK